MGSDDPETENGGRRTERLRLDAPARLRPNSWSSVEIQMLDMSQTGFRARCEARVRPGGAVSLDVPGIGAVEAQVEWQRGDEFGARFYGELELDRCGWTLKERHNTLAQLLVERAAAKRAGRVCAESQLRRRILSALPMHKGSAAR
jgi:hypothetical protein